MSFSRKNKISPSRYVQKITRNLTQHILAYVANGPIMLFISSYYRVTLENTDLLFKGKYQYIADLLFKRLVFSCFANVELKTDLLVWTNLNQSNLRSAIQ